MKAKFLYLIVLAAFLALAVAFSPIYGSPKSPAKLDDFAQNKKVYICPMHPQIMQDTPGTCPICGMDLVEQKGSAPHEHGIQIDTATEQKLGLRLVSVKKTMLSGEIDTFGNVAVDEASLYNVTSKFEGSIKKFYVSSVGQKIEKGQPIYEIYSPELISRQREYLSYVERRKALLQTVSGDALIHENEYLMDQFQELARERARFLRDDIDVATVQEMEDYKRPVEVVKILAQKSGVVTQINAREGSEASPSMPLFVMADMSKAWVEVALYPDQAARVKIGDEVTAKSPDGNEYQAKIDFLAPLAENNRVKARVSIARSGLRPGSFVDVTIRTQPHEALTLPRSAVMKTGRGSLVMLSRGQGKFLPVYVETGSEIGDEVEIADGLSAGAEVAANGQFLLDAGASLAASAERMKNAQ